MDLTRILSYSAIIAENLIALDSEACSGYTKLTETRRILCYTLAELMSCHHFDDAVTLLTIMVWAYNQKDGAIERHLDDCGLGLDILDQVALYPAIEERTTVPRKRKEGRSVDIPYQYLHIKASNKECSIAFRTIIASF